MFMHGFGFGWMILGGLGLLVFGVVVIVLIIFGIRALARSGSNQPAGPAGPAANRALDILKERYARGEITKDQFDSMRRDLAT
jgi:putative membrane protein